jgi:hypothetical protein
MTGRTFDPRIERSRRTADRHARTTGPQRVGIVRRVTTVTLAGGVAITALLGGAAAGGQTCPCPPRDPAAVVKQADVIFAGRPLAATTDSSTVGREPNVPYQARFTFDVVTVLKGSTPRATTVVTPVGPCGAGFVVGGDYLVTGKRQGDAVFTDACQGNAAGLDAIRTRSASIRATLAAPPQAR